MAVEKEAGKNGRKKKAEEKNGQGKKMADGKRPKEKKKE